jgi:hypothetical protein
VWSSGTLGRLHRFARDQALRKIANKVSYDHSGKPAPHEVPFAGGRTLFRLHGAASRKDNSHREAYVASYEGIDQKENWKLDALRESAESGSVILLT